MEEPDRRCLKAFDALPDLLALAKEIAQQKRLLIKVSAYDQQDTLRSQYRQRGLAFRHSMPLRHYGACLYCAERFTEIRYLLENPASHLAELEKLGLRESRVHAIRVHGENFTEPERAFFNNLS